MTRSRADLASELAAASAEASRLCDLLFLLRRMHVLDARREQELAREWSAAMHRWDELHASLTRLDRERSLCP